MSKDGLSKDGGINFTRKRNFETKEKPKKGHYGIAEPEEPEEEIEEPRNLDTEELLRQERLSAQLSKAKGINYSGFAVNGGSIVGLLFFIDSYVFDPNTLEMLELIFNKTLGLNIDFPNIISLLQEYKAQLISGCIGIQTMLVGYKDTCQKALDRDSSVIDVINEELEKIGI